MDAMAHGPRGRATGVVAFGWLAILVGLGALQIRWIDAWSRGEEARLRRFVEGGVQRVAQDLGRALEDLEESFQLTADAPEPELGAALLAALRAHSGPLRPGRVLWLDPRRPEAPIGVDARAGIAPIEWDSLGSWEPVGRALVAGEPSAAIDVTVPATPPGVVVPFLPAGGDRMHAVLLLVDPEELGRGWLADRVDQHLVASFEDELRVVVTHGGRVIHATEPEAAELAGADAAFTVGGGEKRIQHSAGGRLVVERRSAGEDSIRSFQLDSTRALEDPAGGAEPAGRRLVLQLPAWEVRARHATGSIAAAVATRRRSQLGLGLGMLLLLMAAGVLLSISAQRARALARRQVEFVAGVTHELRTPLSVILSAAENLRDSVVTEPGHARRYGGLIHDEARRLTEFVEHALSLAGARTERGAASAVPFELEPVVRRVVDRRSGDAGAPSVEVELPGDLPRVLGDPMAVEHALDNLISNALKYGGEPSRVGVRATGADGAVDVTVWDRGPGIPPDERDRLFEPFFRGRTAQASQTPGSGLGLAVVRRVVEDQGGSVSVASDVGAGSAFTLHLRASA